MQHDVLNRFIFDDFHLRGEMVQLQESYKQILTQRDYPQAVARLLGELLSVTSLLTATIKLEGDITVQLQGDGPLNFAAVSGTHLQELRGTARWDENLEGELDFAQLVGKGYLAITITPNKGERYQGVVDIDANGLASTIENYFNQSEQLPTRLWLFSGEHQGKAHAAGMLIQALPNDDANFDDNFNHIAQLCNTVRDEELFELDAQTLLYRLFHQEQEQVRLYEPSEVCFKCSCSHERSAAALLHVELSELREICEEQGHVSLNCDFCGSEYKFDLNEVEAIFAAQMASTQDQIH